ncbi:membrane protein [Bacillus shivajii]|uniref:YczE/YyaS/YitT family protein n=1 Tax=Bacillus shivajii TaxID=1983719 RepID=UPI001CFB1BBA|nr:membrane protein [Bacillus shivajii]UCZ52976.1 membrane protein [Bacillus shivajii]
MKNLSIRTGLYILGLLILSFGISMMVIADLGAGPWDALFVGLSIQIGLTVGTWIFIVGFLLILLNAYLMKQRPDITALITMFILGLFIDFWLLVVFPEMAIASFMLRVVMVLVGITFMGLGIAVYLPADLAKNPIDSLMLAVQHRTGKSMKVSKTIIEIGALIMAFIFSGPIGVGTLLSVFAIGPLIQMFHTPLSAKLKFS